MPRPEQYNQPKGRPEREAKSIARRLADTKRRYDNARLLPAVLSAQGRLEVSDSYLAETIGIPYTALARWRCGELLPTKHIPAVESWLARQAGEVGV